MPHLPNHRRSLPILLTASMALIAAACAPGISETMLGDRVWGDGNINGIQDPGEPGAAGVTVSLYQEDGALVASTKTDDLGAYQFAGLRSGRYFLEFLALEGKPFTFDDTGDDDEADSDADRLTGRTEVFDLDSSQPDLRWDAGLVLYAPTETPQPPLPPRIETPTPTPTPVVPPAEATYEIPVTFVRVEGACAGPGTFQDTVGVDVGEVADDGSQTAILRQSVHVHTGLILPDGNGEASSEQESYTYTLEFVRDETGKVVRVIFRGRNTYQDAQGCVTVYEVEGEAEVHGE